MKDKSMTSVFYDGNWQEVLVGKSLDKNGELHIVFDLKIDDTIEFGLTIEQVEEMCENLLEYVKQFKEEK